jgi:hypothetical protein
VYIFKDLSEHRFLDGLTKKNIKYGSIYMQKKVPKPLASGLVIDWELNDIPPLIIDWKLMVRAFNDFVGDYVG